MILTKPEILSVLSQFNPWWSGKNIPDLPEWRRAVFGELFTWIYTPPAPRAVLLSGARQVGKTTLLLQAISELLRKGVPAGNILYATFDHPSIKLAGIDFLLQAWRERELRNEGHEYLFLDEAQFIRDFGVWIKHQVDFNKDRRIAFTGSAMPLIHKQQESGVGRWHTIPLPTLSFYEYLQLKESNQQDFELLKNIFNNLQDNFKKRNNEMYIFPQNKFYDDPNYKISELFSQIQNKENFLKQNPLPQVKSLRELFDWPQEKFIQVSQSSTHYVGQFHDYLVRGGFPQTVRIKSLNQAQRLLREDIIDKVLKRDMTALFGVRNILELEQTFLYLCMHDGGLLDMKNLCENLEVKRPTAQHFIDLLEATHLIYRLFPYGYGKDILRAKSKIYLADAAISPAVLLKGKSIVEDPEALSIATETAVFKHLFTRYYSQNPRFTYWQGKNKHEVDVVAELGSQIIPFEVKYRAQHTGMRELKGLKEFCEEKKVDRAYIITKALDDFGESKLTNTQTRIMRIPAPLLCYWMGEAELLIQNSASEDIP